MTDDDADAIRYCLADAPYLRGEFDALVAEVRRLPATCPDCGASMTPHMRRCAPGQPLALRTTPRDLRLR